MTFRRNVMFSFVKRKKNIGTRKSFTLSKISGILIISSIREICHIATTKDVVMKTSRFGYFEQGSSALLQKRTRI